MFCESLIDINKTCKGNSGGVVQVGVQDMDEIELGLTPDGLEVVSVTTGRRFVSVPMQRGRGSYVDTSTIDQASGVSAISGVLTVRLPHRNKEQRKAIIKMGQGQRLLAVHYKDGNGRNWLLTNAVLTSAGGTTGENTTDANQNEIAFTHEGGLEQMAYEITQAQADALYEATVAEITSVSPSSAEVGDVVSLVGAKLLSVTAVKFGSTTVTAFNIVNDEVLTVEVPIGLTAGTVSVSVVSTDGDSNSVNLTIVE